jgi:dGTP triphosphohydrolase
MSETQKHLGCKIMEKNSQKNHSFKETTDAINLREFEQTQELLVGLTNELFEKVEKMNSKTKESKTVERILVDKSSQEEEENKETKIIFSDLSWYKKKLENSTK